MEEDGHRLSGIGRAIAIIIVLAMVLPVSLVITGTEPSAAQDLQASQLKDFYNGNTKIKLASAEFDVNMGPQGLPLELCIDSYDGRVNGHYIVQFDGAVKQMWKARLHQLGAEIGSYVPNNAFVVKMSAEVKAEVENLEHVQYVGIYQPAYKIPPHMSKDISLRSDLHSADALDYINFENLWQNSQAIGDGEKIPVSIITHEGENPYNVAALILKSGGNVLGISETGNSVRAEVSNQGIQILSFVNEVEFIMPYYQPEPMLSDANRWEQSKAAPWLPVWNEGIRGEGIIVGVADTGLNLSHPMFIDPGQPFPGPGHRKVVRIGEWSGNSVDESGHGTRITGCAVGDDINMPPDLDGLGMAFKAKVSFDDVGASDGSLSGIPQDMKDVYQMQYDDGASLSLNSWGEGCVNPMTLERTYAEGTYDNDALNADWFMWENKNFQVFLPAGNDRNADTAGGPPYNCTITPPGTAKNSITVAAHNPGAGWQNTESYSSYGPTRDANWDATSGEGRLKPDISSVGNVMIVWPGGPSVMAGTSVSSGLALGDGALVAQYYKDGYFPVTFASPVAANGFTPSAALVKASMINGARDATAGSSNVHDYNLNGHTMDYPNNDQGWGMTDLGDSLYFNTPTDNDIREMEVDDNQVGLMTGQYREYKFFVEDSSDPLEISLVWTDYKGSIATCGALVNDLELTVTDPVGTTYYGNNYGSASRESDSSNPAGRDHANNVECVLDTTPAVGEWTINVSASNIPVGPQPYALVLTGDFDDGYGWVKLDKHVYNNGDTVQIEVKDINIAGSLAVTLVSSTGDTEAVTLNEVGPNARRFTGTIITGLIDVASDGVIAIENGGWISAQYIDSSPMHISYAYASIDVTNPMIFNVHVTDITNTAAIVHWTTDVPATSQVFYGETIALGSFTSLNSDMVLSHSVVITGLTGFTNYYFDVESTSMGGVTTRDTNGGTHYMFTTVDNPDVLIVQEHSDVESSEEQVEDWKWMLDNYNWTYCVWEILKNGLPSVSDLNAAKAILWDVGEGYPQLGSDERALLQTWINQPGQQLWFVTGQDISWDMSSDGIDGPGTDVDNNWRQTYLRCDYRRDDANGGGGNNVPPLQLIGTTHPISIGLGPFNLIDMYGAGRFWPDDIVNNQGGDIPPPWIYSIHAGGGDAAAIAYNSASFKLVYEAFTHIMIEHVSDQALVLDRSLIWLFGGDHPDIEVIYPNGGETVSGTSVSIDWTVANANTIDVQISRDGGQSYVVEATGLPGITTSYSWDTETSGTYGPGLDFPNGDYYRVKIIGYSASMQGFDISDSNFTVDNGISGDDQGPVIWAGSVKPSPIPVRRGENLHITAIADDRFKGNSNIDRMECYIDGTAPADLISDMNPADVFDSPLESAELDYSVTEPVGVHTLYVRARDAINNWGGFESVEFHVIAGPPFPPLIDLTSPDGGEVWMGGSSQSIIWDMNDFNDPLGMLTVNLYYSTDSGSTYPNLIVTGLTGFLSNPCTYNWDPVALIDSTTVRIRAEVFDIDAMSATDESLADFEIDSTAPAPATNIRAELTAPNHVTIYWDPSPSLDVDHYEVYYILNNWDPTGDTYNFLTDTGMATSYRHNNTGVNNPSSYSWQIRIYDAAGHETRTLVQAQKFSSTLSTFANPSGWFLLGYHLELENTTVEYVLQSLMPNVDHVMLYRDGVWLHWSPYWPPSLNTLTDIYQGEGFWAHLTASDRFCLAGRVTDLSIPLKAGWNCVAYPFAERTLNTANIITHLTMNCPTYVGMEIADYTALYRLKVPDGTEILTQGSGFWIRVNADTTWNVFNY